MSNISLPDQSARNLRWFICLFSSVDYETESMDWVMDEARLAEAKFGQMSILRRWDLFDLAMI